MLTHTDDKGKANMVDVSEKPVTERTATAEGRVLMKPATVRLILDNGMKKGDVLAAARLAGIMAAKRTAELIPLCHTIPLQHASVELTPDEAAGEVRITATAACSAKTGVEMEALTAVSIAALTLYDMCKAADKGMRIEGIRLMRKTGGRSGDYTAPEEK
jgi:cyclic pyranopterin monophosphate synthase